MTASRSPEPAEVLNSAFEYHLSNLHTAMPGRVEVYDSEKQKADVKPLIKRRVLTANGSELLEEIPVIPDVPVMFPRSGEFAVTVPVAKGDFVLLIFCERSIDRFVSGSGSETDPDDFRMHDLTDAVALPGFAPYAKALARADKADMVVGHQSGKGVAFFKSGAVHVGAQNAGDSAALDSKVQAQLTAIQTTLTQFVAEFNAHTHVDVLPLIPAPSPGNTGPAQPPSTAIYSPGGTNSAVLKVDS